MNHHFYYNDIDAYLKMNANALLADKFILGDLTDEDLDEIVEGTGQEQIEGTGQQQTTD